MPQQNLYFYSLSNLTETPGTDGFGFSTGTIFPSGDTPNILANNSGFGFTPATLQMTGSGSKIVIDDNDADLNDEDFVPPTLVSDPDGVTNSVPGQEFELSYSYELSGSDGSTIQIQVIDFVNPSEPLGGNYSQDGITATAPLLPGVTYTVTRDFDGLGIETNIPYSQLVPCFCSGTRIQTPKGERPIEKLQEGDLVMTADRGAQPIKWIGHKQIDIQKLREQPELCAIRFATGSLGLGLPERPLRVSPQHRLLVRSRIAERVSGQAEVLVAAKKLLPFNGVSICMPKKDVTYYHFATDSHDVIFANGAPAETLYLGEQSEHILSEDALTELRDIFGEDFDFEPARTFVVGRDQRDLVERHRKNKQPLVAPTAH